MNIAQAFVRDASIVDATETDTVLLLNQDVESVPTHAEVRRILVVAADVVFSDGVPDDFISQWADETVFLLSLEQSATSRHRTL